jgi:SAM-dependent methyltransferase
MRYQQASIYDYPRYYELVYGSDWKAEYDFLCGSFRRYARRTVHAVFEPACGTGRVLWRLGKAGFRVSGLDVNPHAVEYCNRRLVRHGLPPSVWVGDMADFQLPRPVDAGMNLINSFRHLATESAAVRHLEMMAAALRPGGVYVLGLHLTPTQGVPQDEERWSARRGHLAVTARLWTKRRDSRRRVETCGTAYDIYTPTRRMRLRGDMTFRMYTWPQFRRLLARVPALELAAVHDFSYNLEVPVRVDARTEDAVFVLRVR